MVARAQAKPERTLYLAFNKSVAEEAKGRFPITVTSKTQHSLAYGAIIGRSAKYTLGKLSIFKTSRYFKVDYYLASLVHKTLECWCNSADEVITVDHAAPDLIERYNDDMKPVEVDMAKKLWTLILDARSPDFPMTHGGYLKLYQLSKPRLAYDVIMLDEAQDTNPVTQDIVMRQAQNGSRLFLAGDPYQQIYAWRGAVDALQKIEADPFYLTQSFRFGPEVAGVANSLLRTFFGETRPLVGLGAAGAIVEELPKPPYTYLSRTNAHLFAYATVLAGKFKLYTPGANGVGNLPLFDSVMNVYHLWKGNKFEVRDPELKMFQDYWELKDFVETGNADAEHVVSVAIVDKYQDQVPAQVEKVRQSLVPQSSMADITLSTAHRAKGLEWDNVILCEDFPTLYDEETGHLKPIGYGDRQKMLAPDEVNLLYVAVTRAKRNLKLNKELERFLRSPDAVPVPVVPSVSPTS